MKTFSDLERAKLQDAVATAEKRTRAKFALVVVPLSDRYAAFAPMWAAALAFAALGALALFDPLVSLRLAFLITAAVFGALAMLFEWLPIRLMLVPRHVKHAHAQSLAAREFAAHILSHREPGALFFVSLGESYAEILADRDIHARVGEAAWAAIVAGFVAQAKEGAIVDGLVTATQKISALLEQHHPVEG
ncbi:MAG: hypothetical protein HY243_00395 [Proteobacteria bacterium]|nr:hypothetical protein [Pseudomonadota bacterium]